jgi:glutathione S-transferase
LGPTTAIELLFDLAAKHTPWPLSYITKGIRGQMQKNYTGPELKKAMVFLESELGDAEWFNGKEFGRSDVMLSWPFDTAAQRKWINFEKDYPKLAAWRQRIQDRPAWKRGIEKGNGYDTNKW